MNIIANNPVTQDNINMAENIFRPDIDTLKGKTTRMKPTPIIEDYIEIPNEIIKAQHNIMLCINTMYVNRMPF
jgi:hypothetical protein